MALATGSKTTLRAAIVGAGEPLARALDLLGRIAASGRVPGLAFAGAADVGSPAAPAPGTFPDLAALAAAVPEIDVVLDLRPHGGELPGLPPQTAVLGPEAAAFWLETLAPTPGAATDRPETGAFENVLLDCLEDAIVLLDDRGRVLALNRAAAEEAGRPARDLLGAPCEALFPDAGRERPALNNAREAGAGEVAGETPPWRRALAEGRPAEAVAALQDAAGRTRYFRTTAYPLPRREGAPGRTAVIRRDVSRDVVLERRLKKSERLAAIGELSMFISHEIRNPLFAIAGFANSLLRHESLDEAARDKAAVILQESKRLDDILKNIINFSRPTEAKSGEVDLNLAVADTLGLMRVGLEMRDVTLRQETPPGLPKARGDQNLIKQCLINLLKNAMEAMPRGGRLTVSSGQSPEGLFLKVADDGEGIAPENLEQVFNPFFSGRNRGAGLGLPMTRKIMEDMGGSISLASEPGKGTEAVLYLPPFLDLNDRQPLPEDHDHA